MRETIKYVDADHKFGKTQIFINTDENIIETSGSGYYAYKDAEFTTKFTADELIEACENGAYVTAAFGDSPDESGMMASALNCVAKFGAYACTSVQMASPSDATVTGISVIVIVSSEYTSE